MSPPSPCCCAAGSGSSPPETHPCSDPWRAGGQFGGVPAGAGDGGVKALARRGELSAPLREA